MCNTPKALRAWHKGLNNCPRFSSIIEWSWDSHHHCLRYESFLSWADFDVVAQCAEGYHGKAVVQKCQKGGATAGRFLDLRWCQLPSLQQFLICVSKGCRGDMNPRENLGWCFIPWGIIGLDPCLHPKVLVLCERVRPTIRGFCCRQCSLWILSQKIFPLEEPASTRNRTSEKNAQLPHWFFWTHYIHNHADKNWTSCWCFTLLPSHDPSKQGNMTKYDILWHCLRTHLNNLKSGVSWILLTNKLHAHSIFLISARRTLHPLGLFCLHVPRPDVVFFSFSFFRRDSVTRLFRTNNTFFFLIQPYFTSVR